jgi:hypothetical protein
VLIDDCLAFIDEFTDLLAQFLRGRSRKSARARPQFDDVAIRQHNLEKTNFVAGRSVFEPMASRGVGGQHASHRRHAPQHGIWAEQLLQRSQLTVEARQNHAGLQSDGIVVDPDDPPHRGRKIDRDSRS